LRIGARLEHEYMSGDGHQDHLFFESRRLWRAWLRANHARASQAWVVLPKRGHSGPALTYEEAVEEALCFGWIDGLLNRLDATRYLLRFSPRRAGSIWSASNKKRVAKLIRQRRMTSAGLAMVRQAKRNGQWREATLREATDRPPADLLAELRKARGRLAAWRALPPSRKKQVLYWLASAKREATRRDRLRLVAERWLAKPGRE
jgi:uncharacterized protein YdeI (YjbR/CyaY-like superfamily)